MTLLPWMLPPAVSVWIFLIISPDSRVALEVLSASALSFISHHCKATPLFTGAGGLDGGIQRQQVVWSGDVFHGGDNFTDLVGASAQLFNDRSGTAYFFRNAVMPSTVFLTIAAPAWAVLLPARSSRGTVAVAGNVHTGGRHLFAGCRATVLAWLNYLIGCNWPLVRHYRSVSTDAEATLSDLLLTRSMTSRTCSTI